MMLSMGLRVLSNVRKEVQKFKKMTEVSHRRAIKVEAFRLRGQMQREMIAGAPGGMEFDNLTFMARRRRGRSSWLPDKPLSRLGRFVRYDVKTAEPLAVGIGWTEKVQPRLRKIVQRQQEGFTSPISEKRESFFRHRGGEVSEKSDRRRFFFLRKSTSQFKTPARPIIDPFWNAHRAAAWANIRRNFQLKMEGKRI